MRRTIGRIEKKVRRSAVSSAGRHPAARSTVSALLPMIDTSVTSCTSFDDGPSWIVISPASSATWHVEKGAVNGDATSAIRHAAKNLARHVLCTLRSETGRFMAAGGSDFKIDASTCDQGRRLKIWRFPREIGASCPGVDNGATGAVATLAY